MDIVREIADKYQDFFNFMNQEHDLILTIDEMNEIVYEVEKLKEKFDDNDFLEIKKPQFPEDRKVISDTV